MAAHSNKKVIPGIKIIANNKRASRNYELFDRFEAGIVLTGAEVKSVKAGSINLQEAWVRIDNGQAWLASCYISPWEKDNSSNHKPNREKKLLLHKKEIYKLIGAVQQKGLSIVPTKVYLKNSRIKLEFALGKGKKLYDKRRDIKEKEIKRNLNRILKNRRQ